ncbi:MAG: hypothetical protein IJO56_00830 [Oscillospiraceae bacterium]|nr:hypothetical protein [Oscillospiraceae bacterium]
MTKKRIIAVVAIVLAVATVAGIVFGIAVKPGKDDDDSTDHTHLKVDELYVRELLDGTSVDDIIDDPDWEANVVDTTVNYIMVDADKFDFSKKIGVEDGYTNVYFNTDSREIEMLQHNYVTYTNDLDSKKELQDLIANVQGDVTKELGNPSQSFMLMNTTGEMQDYDGLSIDEMIDKLLDGGHVMYVMYESNGLRYEMNIMFSDDTIYSIVWIYDDSHLHGDNCEH